MCLEPMAHTLGFKPRDPVKDRRFSRPMHSITLPRVHFLIEYLIVYLVKKYYINGHVKISIHERMVCMPNNTIADNLQRLITAKTDIKNAIITMGGGAMNHMV